MCIRDRRSALAAGRALARLHHSELLAACMHAWHARAERRIRTREVLCRAATRTVSRCWHAWVHQAASARALAAVRCAIESSRRRRTFQKVMNAWWNALVVSQQTREEAAALAVQCMRRWRCSRLFATWQWHVTRRRDLVSRAQVLFYTVLLYNPGGIVLSEIHQTVLTNLEYF